MSDTDPIRDRLDYFDGDYGGRVLGAALRDVLELCDRFYPADPHKMNAFCRVIAEHLGVTDD